MYLNDSTASCLIHSCFGPGVYSFIVSWQELPRILPFFAIKYTLPQRFTAANLGISGRRRDPAEGSRTFWNLSLILYILIGLQRIPSQTNVRLRFYDKTTIKVAHGSRTLL